MTAVAPRSAGTHDGLVDVGIITVTYNSAAHVGEFLSSIDAARGELTVRVIVVDNGSTDGTAGVVEGFAEVEFHETGHNGGYAAGINHGRALAGPCRAILVANPDLRFGVAAIEHLFTAVRAHGGVSVPRIEDTDGTRSRSLRREPTVLRRLGDACFGDRLAGRPSWLSITVHDPAVYDAPAIVDWATGAMAMIDATCDRSAGPWDETYFLFSEEVEFAHRVRSIGHAIRYVPDAVVVHEIGGSRGGNSYLGLIHVNELRYYRRRHGRLATAAFAAAQLSGLALRSHRADHRQAARALGRAAAPLIARGDRAAPDHL